jgi:hypothetical protein
MPKKYTTYDPVSGRTTTHTSLQQAKKEARKQLKAYPFTHEDLIRIYLCTWTHSRRDSFEGLKGYMVYDRAKPVWREV